MLILSFVMQGACEVVTSGAAVTAGFVGLYVADFSLNFQSIKCVALLHIWFLAISHAAGPAPALFLLHPPGLLVAAQTLHHDEARLVPEIRLTHPLRSEHTSCMVPNTGWAGRALPHSSRRAGTPSSAW